MPASPVVIVDVALDQLAELDAVMARAFEPRYGEAWTAAQCLSALALPGYVVRVALQDRKVVGFYIARQVAGETELLLLAVDPPVRGKGIGAHLVDDWINWASDAGADRFFLEMRIDNPARRLYERFGLSECGLRRAYYRGGDSILRDAITMQLIATG